MSIPEMATNANFERVHYVAEGMKLITPAKVDGKWTGLRVVVTCAAGEHARVANEKRGFEEWRHVRDLRRETLPQQPPHPLDRVQEPASHADGQQGRDEG